MKVSGGCHCGAVRFEAELPAPPVPGVECNCSVCRMTGFLHVMVPHERFELMTGREALTSYRFGTGTAEHLFCRHCGVKSFYQPRSHPDAWSVNANCLDSWSNWRWRNSTVRIGSRPRRVSTRETSADRAGQCTARCASRSTLALQRTGAGCRSGPASRRVRRSRRMARPRRARDDAGADTTRVAAFFRVHVDRGERAGGFPGTVEPRRVARVGPDEPRPRSPHGSTGAQHTRAGRAVEEDRAGPRLRRDDRHRNEPARASSRQRSAELDGLTIDTLHSHLACADEDTR